MRALRCARQAFTHFYGSNVTASPFICRQHAAFHPTKSGNALEILRLGNIDGYIDQENLLRGSIAFQASQAGVRSYHETSPSGKRQQGNEGSHKADHEPSDTRNKSGGIPERIGLSDGNNACSSQAADTTQDSGQESRTSKDGEESPQHEAAEARQKPTPEEDRYAAEFQRVAGEPWWHHQ